ncbi:MAG: gliding motility-associated-like protein [Crocinitomicaceae bacterium]|jgi:gliding motility-associated-like protein
MRLLTTISLLLLPWISIGQGLVTSVQAPDALVQNVLLGSGVTVSNISYNGAPTAIGSFDGTNCNVGLASGVVMTTGTVLNQGGAGPHGPNNSANAGMDNGRPGFSLLTNIVGTSGTFNAAILEFDFVPYSDSVSFNYVFGSEEYPEYVNAGFNDVFAFFISGPGISGMQNIAKLPSGQTVSIDNVNAGSNPGFFVNNGDGSTAPQNGSPNYIQYDGFTRVLTAESEVQCGETYHLIIAIADAGDPFYDSGIFLEANSLSSKTPVEMSHQMTQNVFNDPNIMAEGCVSTTVTLERGTNNLATPMTIPIILGGTAIEGTDYTNIPNSVTFPAGVQIVTFSFDALQDGIVEGQESVIITLPILDPCGNSNPLELTIYIEDVQPVEVEITGGQINCPGETITLTATPSGGSPPYTFLWSTGATTPTITVTPLGTTNYSVQVTDDCLGETAIDDIDIIVPVLPPLTLNETADITEICPFVAATLEANPVGGSGNYTYQWSSNFEPDLGTDSTIDVLPSTSTTYTITVTDNCGNTATETIVYTITSPPLTLEMTPDVEICPGDSVLIGVTASGGFGNYFYLWPHSAETTQFVWVHPANDGVTTYRVLVSDECQTFTVEGTTNVTVIHPIANFTITSETIFNNLPIQFQNLTINGATYEWDFGDFNSSTFVHPSNTYSDPGYYVVTLIATDDKGCTDTISKPIDIEEEWYIYVPNTFTPDGNRFNNDFRASTVGIQELSIAIFNRWGQIVFSSNELDFVWDGTYNGNISQDGTYTYKIEFLTNSGRKKMIPGHVNVLR